MAKSTKKRTTPERWQPVFYETARGRRPAWDFLVGEEMPIGVSAELLVTIRAVLQVGPPRFLVIASMLRSDSPTEGAPMYRSKESAVFAELLAETFPTASERAAHEREVAKLVAFAELLIALDEVRAGSQISKAELARRIGVKPSVVSRLLDGKGRNVQLATIADVADALDVYIELRVRPQPKRKRARHAPIEVLAA
jgi:DNA-binding Xre family transcriptional regulator